MGTSVCIVDPRLYLQLPHSLHISLSHIPAASITYPGTCHASGAHRSMTRSCTSLSDHLPSSSPHFSFLLSPTRAKDHMHSPSPSHNTSFRRVPDWIPHLAWSGILLCISLVHNSSLVDNYWNTSRMDIILGLQQAFLLGACSPRLRQNSSRIIAGPVRGGSSDQDKVWSRRPPDEKF